MAGYGMYQLSDPRRDALSGLSGASSTLGQIPRGSNTETKSEASIGGGIGAMAGGAYAASAIGLGGLATGSAFGGASIASGAAGASLLGLPGLAVGALLGGLAYFL